jgi:acyl-CoA dehydrogenase
MNFELNDEQKLMVETAAKIGQQYGLNYWRDLDKTGKYPHEIWEAICSAGFCGIALPESCGGSGFGMLEMALVVEALCVGGGGSTLAQLFMVNPIFGGIAIDRFGTEEHKQSLLPDLVAGKVAFCMALTESNAGSNSLEIKTMARPHGNGWRLSGQKIWITSVPQSTHMLVVARTTPMDAVKKRSDGLSLFVIESKRAGVSHHSIEKLGTNTLPSSSLFFEDVDLHPGDLLGTIDKGWQQLLEILNPERIVTTAGLTGAIDLALNIATEYARNRKVFNGTPIGAYQGIQFPLAQAYAEGQCARMMNLKAAWLADQRQPYGTEANMAKLLAAQAAADAIERCMQTMGGMGYAKESHLERLWRDARLFRFAPVSEEMILNYIATSVLGLPRSY